MMNDIERYEFWHSEMTRLNIALCLKEMCLRQLPELERQRIEFLENGSSFGITLEYYDGLINNYLERLNHANIVLAEEVALYDKETI